ncbi:DUF1127 domain-containing protein [Aliiroseovarius sp. KMU-50]|uniref:DUF1127 domain-containing protein n=1 Tax=Aliiroseovarius salicola TaxID=3009082 RepID=A0ABT4W5T1_9RHOB|nr:DUF1127 domain-containing protein [Aliiroseovarius sp. KMU-50]MDA5095825.1 DUF1127 domain-containing protein [Aliiroseovarius sp. KMU-50]
MRTVANQITPTKTSFGGFNLNIRKRMEIRRQRIRLGELSDHMLRDIGITRDQAMREADRPFWDPPHPLR